MGLAATAGRADGSYLQQMVQEEVDAVARRDGLSRRLDSDAQVPWMPVAALLGHLRVAHGAQLGDSGLCDRLADQAGYVHAAMHNSRAHPGHFHHDDQVLHLWEATARIAQVDTCGRT
jgi:hypothetical protein